MTGIKALKYMLNNTYFLTLKVKVEKAMNTKLFYLHVVLHNSLLSVHTYERRTKKY